MPKPTDNIELVVQMMRFSRHGALAQVFIVEAIRQTAERVAEIADEEIARLDKESVVDFKAWRAVARELKQQMDEFYRA